MTEQHTARLRLAAFVAALPLLFGAAALARAAIEPHGENPTARSHMSGHTSAHTPTPSAASTSRTRSACT